MASRTARPTSATGRRSPGRERTARPPGTRPTSKGIPCAAWRAARTGRSKSTMFQPVTTSGSRARRRSPSTVRSARSERTLVTVGRGHRWPDEEHLPRTSRASEGHRGDRAGAVGLDVEGEPRQRRHGGGGDELRVDKDHVDAAARDRLAPEGDRPGHAEREQRVRGPGALDVPRGRAAPQPAAARRPRPHRPAGRREPAAAPARSDQPAGSRVARWVRASRAAARGPSSAATYTAGAGAGSTRAKLRPSSSRPVARMRRDPGAPGRASSQAETMKPRTSVTPGAPT